MGSCAGTLNPPGASKEVYLNETEKQILDNSVNCRIIGVGDVHKFSGNLPKSQAASSGSNFFILPSTNSDSTMVTLSANSASSKDGLFIEPSSEHSGKGKFIYYVVENNYVPGPSGTGGPQAVPAEVPLPTDTAAVVNTNNIDFAAVGATHPTFQFDDNG